MERAHDHVEAGGHRRHAELRKAAGRRGAIQIGVGRIAVGDMYGDGQVEIAGQLIDRIERRIG